MICKMLYGMKRDEAGGILAYNKIKSVMPSEHTEHIAMIEAYIGQEYDHLQGVEKMIGDMRCSGLSKEEEIHIIGHEIYERINEIEKIARGIGGSSGDKIHKLVEEIERKVMEIKAEAKIEEIERKEEKTESERTEGADGEI